MSRYIDADAIHEKYNKYANHSSIGRGNGKTLARFLDWLDDQPTADVVEVVRCKDCVYWEQATDNSGNCNRAFEITAYGSDYCSYGKRREDG